jgi:citrate lyase beta subunit
MRHFGYLSAAQSAALFERPPERFDRGSGTELLSVALGATLYMPADRPALIADITKQAAAGVTSVVVCLEDAIADEQVTEAEDNLSKFSALHTEPRRAALLFVRGPRRSALLRRLGEAAHLLDGIVLPKFTAISGTEYLLTLEAAEREVGVSLLAMPVIESGAVLYAETRVDELTRLRALLHRDRRRILAVRIGATDLCALYGLRRSPELSIYDIKVVSALIGDVVSVLEAHRFGTGLHRVRAGVGVLRRARTDLQAAAAASPIHQHDALHLRGELVSAPSTG